MATTETRILCTFPGKFGDLQVDTNIAEHYTLPHGDANVPRVPNGVFHTPPTTSVLLEVLRDTQVGRTRDTCLSNVSPELRVW